MKTSIIKDALYTLAEADPGGIGLLRDELGEEEFSRCMSHASGWLHRAVDAAQWISVDEGPCTMTTS